MKFAFQPANAPPSLLPTWRTLTEHEFKLMVGIFITEQQQQQTTFYVKFNNNNK
jgi:hypothetical protein